MCGGEAAPFTRTSGGKAAIKLPRSNSVQKSVEAILHLQLQILYFYIDRAVKQKRSLGTNFAVAKSVTASSAAELLANWTTT